MNLLPMHAISPVSFDTILDAGVIVHLHVPCIKLALDIPSQLCVAKGSITSNISLSSLTQWPDSIKKNDRIVYTNKYDCTFIFILCCNNVLTFKFVI